MPALLVLALALMIVASALKCGDEPIFLYFEKRAARKPDKNASMDINSYRKKKFRILAPFLCSSTYFVQTYYFLHLKKNRERIRIRGGAKCIGIVILAGELGFLGQIFGPLVS